MAEIIPLTDTGCCLTRRLSQCLAFDLPSQRLTMIVMRVMNSDESDDSDASDE